MQEVFLRAHRRETDLKKEEEIGCGRELDFYVFQAETSSPDVAPQPTNRTRKVYRVVDKHRCCTAEMCAASGFGTPSRDELSSSIFLWRFSIYFFFFFFCGEIIFFFFTDDDDLITDFISCVMSRDRNVRSCCAVPWKEHAGVLGAQNLSHRRRHPTQTSPTRSEREKHSAQRESSLHRQHVRLNLFLFCISRRHFC